MFFVHQGGSNGQSKSCSYIRQRKMSKLARADVERISKKTVANTHRQRKVSSCPTTPTRGQISNTTQLLHQVADSLEDEYSTDKIKRLPKKKKETGKKQKPKKERKGVSVWKFVTLDFTKDVNRPELKNKNVTNPFGDILNRKKSKKESRSTRHHQGESSSCPPTPPAAHPTSQLLEEVPEEEYLEDPTSSYQDPRKARRHGSAQMPPPFEGRPHILLGMFSFVG